MTVEQLGNEIYVYHNFLTAEEVEKIYHAVHNDTPNRYSLIQIIPNKIRTMLGPDLDIIDTTGINKLNEGDQWDLHSDNFEYLHLLKKADALQPNEPFVYKLYPLYGIVVYFNSFEGGEIFYPSQNVTYAPQPGDLLIHSAEEFCAHQVNAVLKGVRYSYSNAIYKKIKIPAQLAEG